MNRISPARSLHHRLTTRIVALLAATALLIAPPAGAVDTPAPADQATEATSSFDRYGTAAQDLINQGMEYLGIRYRFGGNSPETGLDCSGLVQNVFRNALGLNLPRAARDMARVGEKVGVRDLKPGDLVFFNTMRKAFSHVGIYVGDGRFLHAPSSGGEVRIDEMNQSYWAKRFNGARRMVPEGDLGLPQAN
ncbi:Cell wall-associated hydrolase, NlpC family [Aromatoleum tolulyticum]|uniref:Cell wall-associated hydrolase, NlpC family n=1 Tax=Aromatoleum tolulyticum TaxID=34027 RepID=A0A1N6R095_9RHOO|nr:C40 family peptidase [Aromatoleum tolulyticum]SIQ22233.1 Cell wall-associated hydrolase, NlpC family [Aromatoleum tolulyticum]